jgi:hypothetical protein
VFCFALALCSLLFPVLNSPAQDRLACPKFVQPINNLTIATCGSAPVYFAVYAISSCCSNVTITCTPPSGTVLSVGQTTNVVCVATDCESNTATTNFTITMVAQTLQIYSNPKTVTNGTAWTFDTPSPYQLSCCAETNGYTLTGQTPVTNWGCPLLIYKNWILSDTCGNTDETTQYVTVIGPESAPPGYGDFLTNGSFEVPALAGNGDIQSTDPEFSLPGWTCPTGSNQFFLEYGRPTGARRYLDGRQAVCLNGQGTPVTLSQTFSTMPGQNYTLSFGQSDAANAGPSASQLTVSVAGLTRVFSRTNDSGYVVKRLHFTATDYCTTLEFTDTSAPPAPSPFLDSVCINTGSTLIAGTATAIPSGSGNFSSYPGNPALNGEGVAFLGLGPAGQQGIYSFPSSPIYPGEPVRIADLDTVIPNTASYFARFTGSGGFPGNPGISFPSNPTMGYVAFWGADSGGRDGIYTGYPGSPLNVVADTTTAIPGGTGNFTAFTGNSLFPGNPTISGQSVVFFGAGSSGQQGIYSFPVDPIYPNGPIKIADLNTTVPDGSGHFTTFTTSAGFPSTPLLSGNHVVFWAGGSSGQQGIYSFPVNPIFPGQPIKIADLNTAIPGGIGNFTDFVGNPAFPTGPVGSFPTNPLFPGSPVFPGGPVFPNAPVYPGNPIDVAFQAYGAGGQAGIYASINGALVRVADTNTAIPGGTGNFTGFSGLSVSGNMVAFTGTGANGQSGIYVSFPSNPNFPGAPVFPGSPIKAIDLNDMLDAKTITGFQLGPAGLSGDPVAFAATFSDGSQGIYTVPVVVEPAIISVVPTAATGGLKKKIPATLQLGYTAPAGYSYSLESSGDLSGGVWTSLGITNLGNGSLLQTILTNPFTQPQQFYRIQQSQ